MENCPSGLPFPVAFSRNIYVTWDSTLPCEELSYALQDMCIWELTLVVLVTKTTPSFPNAQGISVPPTVDTAQRLRPQKQKQNNLWGRP